MKTVGKISSMLLERLAELEDEKVKIKDPVLAERLKIELSLLYDILEDDIGEEYWERIEHQIY